MLLKNYLDSVPLSNSEWSNGMIPYLDLGEEGSIPSQSSFLFAVFESHATAWFTLKFCLF